VLYLTADPDDSTAEAIADWHSGWRRAAVSELPWLAENSRCGTMMSNESSSATAPARASASE
jgi:hypothetical protein